MAGIVPSLPFTLFLSHARICFVNRRITGTSSFNSLPLSLRRMDVAETATQMGPRNHADIFSISLILVRRLIFVSDVKLKTTWRADRSPSTD
jgi:hypothetical protein